MCVRVYVHVRVCALCAHTHDIHSAVENAYKWIDTLPHKNWVSNPFKTAFLGVDFATSNWAAFGCVLCVCVCVCVFVCCVCVCLSVVCVCVCVCECVRVSARGRERDFATSNWPAFWVDALCIVCVVCCVVCCVVFCVVCCVL